MRRYLPAVFLAVCCFGMVLSFGTGCLNLASLYDGPSIHEILWIMMQSFSQPVFLICGFLTLVSLTILVREIHWFSLSDNRLAQNIQRQRSDPDFPLSCKAWEGRRRAFEKKQAVLCLQLQEQQYRYENLCHQLKSGLCAMQLQAEFNKNPAMTRTVRHMNELTEKMLKTAGQNALEKGMTFSSLSLDKLVTDIVVNHPQMVRIKANLAPVRFHGDRFYLQELLLILLDNALEACSVDNLVSLQLESADDHIVLTVKNQGMIDQNQLDAAFRRYVTSRPGHFGIGLAMARDIAQAHHGALCGKVSDGWVTMTLSFPLCRLEKEIL